MSVNNAEIGQQSGNVLPDAIKVLQRQMVEMKTKSQIVGAEAIKLGGIPTSGAFANGPFTIGSGGSLTFNFHFTPSNKLLTLWNFMFTVYIDTYDAAHAYPGGASVTSPMRALRVMNWDDYNQFNATTNVRTYIVRMENYDTVSHNYYIDFKAFIPLLTGTTVA